MNNLFLILLLLLLVIIVPIWLKRRKSKKVNEMSSQRHNKDEVWKTIKQFLKDKSEYGKEIYDSYVIKRNAADYINPNASKWERKNKKQEIKIRKFQQKQLKHASKNSKKAYRLPSTRELYVVMFVTNNPKIAQHDSARAIECEIINKKISRKDWDRKIIINGELDFDKEMEWIAPIKAAEQTRLSKSDAKQRQINMKKQQKQQIKNQKEKAKKEKQREQDE